MTPHGQAATLARLLSDESAKAVLSAFMEAVPSITAIARTSDLRVLYVSEYAAKLVGRPVETLQDVPFDVYEQAVRVLNPDGSVIPKNERVTVRAARGEVVVGQEGLVVDAEGNRISIICNGAPIRNSSGDVIGGIMAGFEVQNLKDLQSGLRDAYEALRDSEQRFRTIFESAAIGIARVGFEGERWIELNDAFCRILGRTREELVGRSWIDVTHPDDVETDLVPFRRMAKGELDKYEIEKRFVHADGHFVWARMTLSLVRDAAGRPDYEIAVMEDISERKAHEEMLRASEARRSELLATLDLGASMARDPVDDTIRFWSAGCERLYGWTAAEAVGRPAHDLLRTQFAVPRAEMEAALEREGEWTGDLRQRRRDGGEIIVFAHKTLRRDQDGRPVAVLESLTDVTVQREAAAAIAERETCLRLATEAGQVGVFDWNLRTNELRWDERARVFWALPPETPWTIDAFYAGLHPDDVPSVEAKIAASLDPASGGDYGAEYRVIGVTDGIERNIVAKGRVFFEDDVPSRMIGTVVDVTKLKQAEAVLSRDREELARLVEERSRELEEARAQAAHAERLRALGQLAGGVAHDFNNVLQAVQGGVAMIEKRAEGVEEIGRIARMIADAAGRGSAITGRLLAFSRRRGELRAEAVDPAALLEGVREVLAQTLGSGIVVRVEAPADLPPLLADKSQLETVLINLAVNARDAMPEGGVLTFSAAVTTAEGDGASDLALSPGAYVRLAVTDTGVGMPQELLARVTEPFFTTKGEGKGTGLGLAMAKSFAEQSGGALCIESAPGRGSTVALWFPLAPVKISSGAV